MSRLGTNCEEEDGQEGNELCTKGGTVEECKAVSPATSQTSFSFPLPDLPRPDLDDLGGKACTHLSGLVESTVQDEVRSCELRSSGRGSDTGRAREVSNDERISVRSFRSVAMTSTFTFFDDLSDKDFCETSHDGQDGGRDGLTEHLVHELGFHTRFKKISSLFFLKPRSHARDRDRETWARRRCRTFLTEALFNPERR